MSTIVLQTLGWVIFGVSTITIGVWLRRNPSKKDAENASRILHFLFWVTVAPPMALGVFYPGLSHYDHLLGLSPLPRYAILRIVRIFKILIGTYLILVANTSLWVFGRGANAFLLTRQLVVTNIYEWTRNPMSLGVYLGSIGSGLLMRSTYMTSSALLVLIPAHIFYLKYFEEKELELRMGPFFLEYKRRVPFLLPRLFPRN